ncbi:MAG TPA: flagellar biosynthesis protein FlhF [Clostridiaceae bacterium]|nr:flagellar biosynthesis protein FlhF [Clostridiaceae bacterium]
MIIKRYIGNNTQEAIMKMKADLGADSLILNTKKVRKKGFLNYFKKPMVEVLAAVDDNNIKTSQNNKEDVKDSTSERTDIVELNKKVRSMEALLNKIGEKLELSGAFLSNNVKSEDETSISSKTLKTFYNNLINNEVSEEYACKIIEDTRNLIKENASINEIVSAMKSVISSILGKPSLINYESGGKPRVVIFVGPTGVGKTTTLAKIAANLMLIEGKKVGLITADTYRIAAVEQLRTYAQILSLPVSVIYSCDEIAEAIKNYGDKDIVLVDTAGRGHRNKTQMEELKQLLEISQPDEVYLVLGMNTSMRTCKEIIKNYDFLKDYKLIFTKADETSAYGIILNTRIATGKSLSYISNGQNVPDDIEVADIEMIIKNLIGSIS